MAKPTGELLTKLRSAMKNKAHVPDILHAYIIPTEDAHQVIMDLVSYSLFYNFVHNCTLEVELCSIYITNYRKCGPYSRR